MCVVLNVPSEGLLDHSEHFWLPLGVCPIAVEMGHVKITH